MSTHFATGRLCFVKVYTNFRWVLTNFTLSTLFQRVVLQLSCPLIFNLENRKYIRYTVCENVYALGMLYFSAHHSVPTLGTNILCNFLFMCIFVIDHIFKWITFLSYIWASVDSRIIYTLYSAIKILSRDHIQPYISGNFASITSMHNNNKTHLYDEFGWCSPYMHIILINTFGKTYTITKREREGLF